MISEQGAELRKFYAPEFVFGAGAYDLAGQYSRKLGASKVLVVTDPGVIAAGWPARVIAGFEEAGLQYCLYSNITPNPHDHEVMAGAEVYQTEACDAIVAVGGGSPIDCAKGIGVVVSNNCPILQCEGIDRVEAPMPPMLCVPTTAGTSADISQFAIIVDTQDRRKAALISKALVPDVSLLDPRPLTTMDAYLGASTGLDALTHAIEAFVSTGNSPITDLHALEAINLVSTHLVTSLREPENLEERGRMMLASLHAGLAFSNAGLGMLHAMSHSLGGLLDSPHGECNAILLETVIEFNFQEVPERYSRVAEAMGVDLRQRRESEVKTALLSAVRLLRCSAGVQKTLGQCGVHSSDISELARRAMLDVCMVTNPRRPSLSDLEVMYERAL